MLFGSPLFGLGMPISKSADQRLAKLTILWYDILVKNGSLHRNGMTAILKNQKILSFYISNRLVKRENPFILEKKHKIGLLFENCVLVNFRVNKIL